MAMNHTESHRANGATRASPSGEKGVVSPAGSKPVCRGLRPNRPTATAPAASTSTRETSSARHATPHESPQADVPSGRTPTMVADRAMSILAETFFQRHENELTALLSLALAFALIVVVDRLIKRR